MHAHASDTALTSKGAAKFFIKNNGDTIVQKQGVLSDKEVRDIQKFIRKNYIRMYKLWSTKSEHGFYGDNDKNSDENLEADVNEMKLF